VAAGRKPFGALPAELRLRQGNCGLGRYRAVRAKEHQKHGARELAAHREWRRHGITRVHDCPPEGLHHIILRWRGLILKFSAARLSLNRLLPVG
jgi:hypothetical protein